MVCYSDAGFYASYSWNEKLFARKHHFGTNLKSEKKITIILVMPLFIMAGILY